MKQLKKEVKQGFSKKAVFQSFLDRGGDPKKGSRYLSFFPEKQFTEKYTVAHAFLLYTFLLKEVISFALLIPVLLGMPIFVSLITSGVVFFMVGITTYYLIIKSSIGYYFIVLLSFKGCFDSFKLLITDGHYALIGMIFHLFFLVYTIVLKTKMFPYQNILNSKKDQDGLYIYQ